jgi:hypothetical protein
MTSATPKTSVTKPVGAKPKPAARKTAAAKAKKAVTAKSAARAKPAQKSSAKAVAAKPAKVKKAKLVRDSFAIPKAEYVLLDELKLRAIKLTRPVKKSELLRAGIKALAAMSEKAFLEALKAVPAIKTGRPKKD